MSRPTATKERTGSRLVGDQRGAVLAEFVVVLMPLLTVFFVFVQLSALAAATLMVKHATIVGARAAAVFSNANQNLPEQCDDGVEDIRAGVRAALGTWDDRMTHSVEVTDQSSRDDDNGQYKLVTVKVTAQYRCEVPLGKAICPGGIKTIVDVKSMPHQGARYKKQCGDSSGVGRGAKGKLPKRRPNR